MDEQFMRTEMLLGSEAMARLRHAHVAVFGLGGVGSWCAEALARSGIGRLTLVDEDTVGLTNLNRQAQALHSPLGMEKAIAMAQRVLDINPLCTVHPISKRYEVASRDYFFSAPYHYVVDAIDLVSCKLDLIETAISRGLPIISALGTGNTVLWSPELPAVPESREAPPPGRRSVPGSVAWVPPCAGLMMAGYVVQQLAAPQSVSSPV